MCHHTTAYLLVFSFLIVTEVPSISADLVHFDLPPTAAATTENDPNVITFTLRLSSMIQSPSMPRIDQWMVTCHPREEGLLVVDYSPRTETASDLSTPIQTKLSQEKTQSLGLHLDSSYSHVAGATAAADNGVKNIESVQFDRTAPVHAVTAAGTIDRGRGVYFKLRWTATQVLEGEKQFQVTLRVPQGWRGSLMDVSVRADRTEKKFAGLDQETVTVGSAHFVIATYRDGDQDAYQYAIRLASAERELRTLAKTMEGHQSIRSLPQMLRHVVAKFDHDSQIADTRWVSRLISGRADPHLDKAINKLPMSLRIAALDYADCRDDFAALSQRHSSPTDESDQVLVAKPRLKNR
jgi:hypothetical protein